MRIYILVEYYYDDTNIIAVFKNRIDAKNYMWQLLGMAGISDEEIQRKLLSFDIIKMEVL